MPKSIHLTDDEKTSLKNIVKSCEDEDKEIRKAMIRSWKKNEEFWHGVQFLFWSDLDETWKSPLNLSWGSDDTDDADQIGSFSDKVIDIFRAHGEAIISALSAQIPAIRFIPDDADEYKDILTATTKSKIADLVARHNKVKLIFLRALFYLAIHGTVASYRYKDSDFKYGSFKVPKIGVQKQEAQVFTCSECNYESQENWQMQQPDLQQQSPIQSQPQMPQQPQPCPQCGSMEPPEESTQEVEMPTVESYEDRPKTRAKLDVFGPLHFKVSTYARKQDECSYFILYTDVGKDIVQSEYPDHADDIAGETLDNIERFSRSSFTGPSDPTEDLKHLVTVKRIWLRPAAFFREGVKEKRDKLIKKFNGGCRFTLIGKQHIFPDEDITEESMDDRWVIGQAGLSTYIYSDPILRPLIQIQEMRNQLVNLIMETISHGIPSSFADPQVVNFDTYGKYECLPGFIYPTKPARPGSRIADGFYTTDRAVLSKEIAMFLAQLDKDAQFVVGSFPSIYGGPSEGKSRTLGEYESSRKMALQRLSICWTFLVEWWISTIQGLVELYITCLTEDEKFATYENGNYVNVWIRMSELQGKTGGVESEASENFPVTLSQKQAIISKMMEMNNEYINSVLYNPENAEVIKEFFALTELKIPGSAQRIKQFSEIQDLLQAGSSGIEPVDGRSAVPVEPMIDDHAVHIAVCKGLLVDPVGMDLKKQAPLGYAQVEAHMNEHQIALQLQTKSNVGTPAGVPPPTTQVTQDE